MAVLQRYWQARFARWPPPPATLTAGYTVLVPVPGDLPVFLDLALAVCRAQDSPGRVATLVVPDVLTEAVARIVAREKPGWPGRLDLLALPLPERWILPRLGDPGRNHAVQLNTAVARTRSTHVVLHDADLFLLEPDSHERQWAHAVEHDLDVLGVDPAWDGWFAEHGLDLAATWEMTARTEWLRAFPPWRHIAHRAALVGDDEEHVFDTMYWAESRTPGGRIAVRSPGGIVHFNHVISTYRKFQSSRRSPGRQTPTGAGTAFRDPEFRLLLIRVLVDLFDTSGSSYDLPSATELARGLGRPGAPVTYESADGATYREFRPRLTRILTGFPQPANGSLDAALAAFDGFYGLDRFYG